MGNAALGLMLIAGLCILAFVFLFAAGRGIERVSRTRLLRSLDSLPESARIVVLGCRPLARDGGPNLLLVGRVAAAAAAYHRATDGRVLCSGRLDPCGLHEADEMTRALVAAGVPRKAIELDRDASRTLDSIRYLQAHHAEEPIVLVSQAFHLPRALFLAERAGLEASGLPAGGPRPARRVRLREALARARAVFDSLALRRGGPARGRSRR